MEGIDLSALAAFATPPVMLGALFFALWRGWLWTGASVDRLVEQWQRALDTAERRETEWRDIALTGVRQVDTLLDAGRTTVAVVDSVRSAVEQSADRRPPS